MQTAADTRKTEIKKKLEKVFDKRQATVLTEVITEAYNELVKASDFNELKGIVKELGVKVGELAEAQRRTEIKVAELSEAVAELSKDVRELVKGLGETRGEVGGLSRSMSYAFENEAYRMLPPFLKERYGIEIKEKFIRTDIRGKEINIFGRGQRNGKRILLVGEAKLRLDERREEDIFEGLQEKVDAVKEEYPDEEIIRLLVTHYATKGFLKKAEEKGIIVVQSF